jgi:magnesium-transporting ATPase (P-type)
MEFFSPATESGATGKSDAIKKLSFEERLEVLMKEDGALVHTDCSVVSGSKVVEGAGKYVVVGVGTMGTFVYALYTLLLTFQNTSPPQRY